MQAAEHGQRAQRSGPALRLTAVAGCYNTRIPQRFGRTVSDTAISYSELGDALARAQAGIDASDLHGSLIGYLCGGGRAEPVGDAFNGSTIGN